MVLNPNLRITSDDGIFVVKYLKNYYFGNFYSTVLKESTWPSLCLWGKLSKKNRKNDLKNNKLSLVTLPVRGKFFIRWNLLFHLNCFRLLVFLLILLLLKYVNAVSFTRVISHYYLFFHHIVSYLQTRIQLYKVSFSGFVFQNALGLLSRTHKFSCNVIIPI